MHLLSLDECSFFFFYPSELIPKNVLMLGEGICAQEWSCWSEVMQLVPQFSKLLAVHEQVSVSVFCNRLLPSSLPPIPQRPHASAAGPTDVHSPSLRSLEARVQERVWSPWCRGL